MWYGLSRAWIHGNTLTRQVSPPLLKLRPAGPLKVWLEMKKNDKQWIIDFIQIKEAGLDFAYCRGDIESAHKIEEDIRGLRVMYEKT